MLGKGIFCIEGDWNNDLRRKTSILSGLELLHTTLDVKFVYKTCGTQNELVFRLKNALKYSSYNILYIATHGSQGAVYFETSVDIIDFFKEHFKESQFVGRIIHFGSCATLSISEDCVKELKRYTGAKYISGFTEDVNFFESTIFEMMYFNALFMYKRKHETLKYLNEHVLSLSNTLGFVMI